MKANIVSRIAELAQPSETECVYFSVPLKCICQDNREVLALLTCQEKINQTETIPESSF